MVAPLKARDSATVLVLGMTKRSLPAENSDRVGSKLYLFTVAEKNPKNDLEFRNCFVLQTVYGERQFDSRRLRNPSSTTSPSSISASQLEIIPMD